MSEPNSNEKRVWSLYHMERAGVLVSISWLKETTSSYLFVGTREEAENEMTLRRLAGIGR